MLKRFLIAIISRLVYYTQRIFDSSRYIVGLCLIKLGCLDRFVLIRMDGGICSQMHFYMIGTIFRNKGYLVKYELEWYKSDGMDMNGLFVRNFDLTKAFHNLDFHQASKFELFFYKSFEFWNDYFGSTPYRYEEIPPPAYLTGYYRDPSGLYADLPNIFAMDYSVLNPDSLQVLDMIKSKGNSVAVHVRRGDLSVYNSAYGNPVDDNYFNKAIEYIESKVRHAFFFFFSDEPDWVRRKLITRLKIQDNYFIVDVNGSDTGYMDLYLIASCKHHITSKGSLGKYGAFLAQSDTILLYDDESQREVWEGQHPNIVFIK